MAPGRARINTTTMTARATQSVCATAVVTSDTHQVELVEAYVIGTKTVNDDCHRLNHHIGDAWSYQRPVTQHGVNREQMTDMLTEWILS